MKCSKCGAECDEKQLFCLRCGTPVNNESLEETSRNIEIPAEDRIDIIGKTNGDTADDVDIIIGRDIARSDREPAKKHADIESDDEAGHTAMIPDGVRKYPKMNNQSDYIRNDSRHSEEDTDSNNDDSLEEELEEYDDSSSTKEKSKKPVIIISSIIGVIVLVAIIAAVVFFSSEAKYKDYYANGMTLYEQENLPTAATQFKKAASVAKKSTDKIDADIMLWTIYSQMDGYEKELEDCLLELISLDKTNVSYYQALIILYQTQKEQSKIDKLIASVKDEKLKEKLKNYDGTTPVANITGGEYDRPLSIELTAPAGSTIYYTVNGGNASSSSSLYKKAINLKKEGTYSIRAISIDENGKESQQLAEKYILAFNEVPAPGVNLNNGTYGERKKFKISIPDGCTVYYTTDGSTPKKSSTKYEKPFKIAEANTIYKFIAIDSNGIASDVVTRIIIFERTYAHTYDDGVSAITSSLIKSGKMENTFGSYEDGSAMYFEYKSLEKIDKAYYYIIIATKEDPSGNTESSTTYAYGADDGSVHVASYSNGKYTFKTSNE
ncbi:MAG: chitobiase/beta-hexosaminidase C-terminal domain-containing protein [Lachnospiraceae bacterium]|nr:chitobiase/beta-hexosaminidase C-terminal domain-containing protein [Lachnospiraceae bacterium]